MHIENTAGRGHHRTFVTIAEMTGIKSLAAVQR
jgi:hypothetical protein